MLPLLFNHVSAESHNKVYNEYFIYTAGIVIMKNTHTVTRIFITTVISLLTSSAFAGPGTLANSPLFTSATAEPNIMFIIDNSGSMEHVVEESFSGDADRYDSSVTYINNCSSPTATTNTIYIYFTGSRPYVTLNSRSSSATRYTVNYNASNQTTGTICFDPNQNYSGNLHASNNGVTPYSFTALYTGNFLNWYFKYNNTNNGGTGTVGQNWTTTSALSDRYKPGTQIRRIIARDSMSSLVTSLEASETDIRLGLAAFYSGQGAKIFDEIKYLDTAQRDSINSNIQNLGDGGGTPLAETLHQIGKYFIGETGSVSGTNGGSLALGAGINDTNGSYNGSLILNPNSASPVTSPVNDSSSSSNDGVFDNFTAGNGGTGSATFESPIQYWCQNNFAVVMTDGLPTNDQNIPSALRDYDTDCVGASPACNTFDRKDTSLGYIYESTSSNPSDYLDDVAQAMFEIDLRPDIDKPDPNNPGSYIDALNNVITYTIAFADQDALNNKLINDTGTQGGGESISATDGQDLVNKFAQVTNSILATTSSAAAVTFNSSTLDAGTTLYSAEFTTSSWNGEIASYPLDPITGSIQFSCTRDVDPGCWLASTHLDALAYNTATSTFLDNREIITFNSTIKKGVPFRAPAAYPTNPGNGITSEMVQDLCSGPDAPAVWTTSNRPAAQNVGQCKWNWVGDSTTSAATTTASQTYLDQIVDYIRGDRTFENVSTTPTFRARQTVLGDIINATPLFVGSPQFSWPTPDIASNAFGETGNRYSDFKTAQNNRTKVLYASANDGMLHAFRTETVAGVGNQAGDEVFAFIPSFVFSNQTNEGLHNLTKPDYSHLYYLDLSPTVSDVYIKGKDSSNTITYQNSTADWYTILIGGSRGGVKKGIFALDVTDPLTITEANADDKVLWEFTNNDDADLGYTYSKPTIALTNAVDGAGLNRWAAIFGNGYQNDSTAVSNGSSCRAILYVVFLDGGLDGTWTLGTDPSTADYMKIDTNVGTTAAGDCNGLSTPTLTDTDGDQILDRVYAGDVQGNMWAFDLSCGGGVCSTGSFIPAYSVATVPQPLFTAIDALGVAQPIMVKPNVSINTAVTTTSSNQPNFLISFGTGQYHNKSDNQVTTKTNTFYTIWDRGTAGLTDDRSNTTAATSTLVGQVLTSVSNGNFRTITSNVIDWTQKYGWYIDLNAANSPDAEERVVVDALILSNIIFFNTFVPNGEICGFGGYGYLMSVDLTTGSASNSPVFDTNGDGIINDSDKIGGDIAVGARVGSIPAGSSVIGGRQYTQLSDRSIQDRKIKVGKYKLEGRVSWRELLAE